MTCIVGLVHEGKVYMGGDSAAVNGYLGMVTIAHPKVYRLKTEPTVIDNAVREDELLIGSCGSVRSAQLIEYKVKLPSLTDDDRSDLRRYIATTLVDKVRAALKDNGSHYQVHGVDCYPGEFLVGVRGELFTVQGDFGVLVATEPYTATGCGGDYALGSLEATHGYPPTDRVRMALEAAAHHNAGVAPPFVIEVLETGG